MKVTINVTIDVTMESIILYYIIYYISIYYIIIYNINSYFFATLLGFFWRLKILLDFVKKVTIFNIISYKSNIYEKNNSYFNGYFIVT